VTLYLVRHAHAGSRQKWMGDDLGRPLSDKGVRQATVVADWLDRRPVGRILSSPALRCTQTVGPLARRRGLEIEVEPALAEGTTRAESAALARKLVADEPDAVRCSHGDVLPDLLDAVAEDGCEVRGRSGLAKGGLYLVETKAGRARRETYLGADVLTESDM
jgi:phosphohistidine phosphatase SixA